MDPLLQTKDDGAVIGYRPNLSYTTELTGSNKTFAEDLAKKNNIAGYFSKQLISFSQNMPAKTVYALANAERTMTVLIDKLANAFAVNNWSEYSDISALVAAINASDWEYANEFINFHKHNYSSPIIPEVMGEIGIARERIVGTSGTFKNIFYGSSDIALEETIKLDTESLNHLMSLENDLKICQMNYVSMMNDGCLDKIVLDYAYLSSGNATRLTDMTIKDSYTNGIGNIMKLGVIKKIIDEDLDEIEYMDSSCSMHNSQNVIDKSLYNYYNTRQELQELLDVSIASEGNPSVVGNIGKYQDKVEEATRNVTRALMGNYSHLSNIYSYEEERRNLKTLYANLLET